MFPDVPPGVPNVLHRHAVRGFNEVWYRKTPKMHRGTETLTGFFHPLDMIGRWNRLYGRHGFLQYQFVVPFDAVETLRTIVAKVAAGGDAGFVNVLKRFGAESGGMLSFPQPGWTLTVDFPASPARLAGLLDGTRSARARRGWAALSRQGRHRRSGRHPRRLSATRRVEGGPLAVRSRRSLGERPGAPPRTHLNPRRSEPANRTTGPT